MLRHFFPEFRVSQHVQGLADRGLNEITFELNGSKAFGFNIHLKNRVVVDNNRLPKVNGFKKGITEAFMDRWIRYQISMWIHVPQTIDFAAIGRDAALISDDVRNKVDRFVQQVGEFAQTRFVTVTLIAGGM